MTTPASPSTAGRLGGRIRTSLGRLAGEGRELVESVVRSAGRNDLLSFASAIAFQTLFAVVPFALATIALLGFFNAEQVWTSDVRPDLRENLEPDAFSVVDRTIQQILTERQHLWLTFGVLFALWQVSGAVRAAMGPLNAIYHDDEGRGLWRRLGVSLLLALAVGPGLVLAALAIHFGPRLADGVDAGPFASVLLFLARWGLAVVVLYGVVWLIVRYGPARRHSMGWASFGSAVVIVAWIGTSLVFGWYATSVADYGSLYGGLASVIVLLTYLYISAAALIIGAQVDACIRERAIGPEEGPTEG